LAGVESHVWRNVGAELIASVLRLRGRLRTRAFDLVANLSAGWAGTGSRPCIVSAGIQRDGNVEEDFAGLERLSGGPAGFDERRAPLHLGGWWRREEDEDDGFGRRGWLGRASLEAPEATRKKGEGKWEAEHTKTERETA